MSATAQPAHDHGRRPPLVYAAPGIVYPQIRAPGAWEIHPEARTHDRPSCAI